jgi:hypothetical protein
MTAVARSADPAMIAQTAAVFFRPGAVTEIRILGTPRQGTLSGYFTDPAAFTQAARTWSGKAPAVYCTLNPCNPALLARAANRLKDRVKGATADHDILHRGWFPLDFDPVRPADISSTEVEHDAALARAEACTTWLQRRGWPEPIAADSGNGGHRLYKVDLPNDDTSRDLLKRGLEALAMHFSDDVVSLDLSVFNAARIWKVYGTLACKGDHLPERPHRLARLLHVPAPVACVTRTQLEDLAAFVPAPPTPASRRGYAQATSFDLAHWITVHGLPVVAEGSWHQGGYRWVLKPCPWNSAHTNRSAFVVRLASGAIAAGCHHNGCQGNDWHALRELYEPGWRDGPAPRATPPPGRVAVPRDGAAQPGPEPRDPSAGPELPAYARVDATRAAAAGLRRGILTRSMDTVTPELTEWLWYPYIALGTLCMLDGDPGIGKSLLSLQLAANVSRGHPFPDQLGKPTIGGGAPYTVLIMTREDSISRTLRPRLDDCGADVTRIHHGVNWPDAEGREQPFTLQHLPQLDVTLQELHPRLVILDPIQSFFGDININQANQTRPLLDALTALAEHYQCAILAIRHPAKPGEGIGKALHRGLGSIDIIGAARTGLFIEQYPGDETRAILAHTKTNLGPKGRSIIFSKKDGHFAWERVTRLSAEDLAGSGRGPNHRAFLEALLWLEKRLEGGLQWNASDIETEAEEQDIRPDTLKRAKRALNVVSRKITGKPDGAWTWRLPLLSLYSTPSTSSSSFTSSTSTTSTSSDKTKTYTEQAPPVVVGLVREVGEEVEVEAVVIDHAGDTPALCPCGGHHVFIKRARDQLCVRCSTTADL